MSELIKQKTIRLEEVNRKLVDGEIKFTEAFRELINIETYYTMEMQRLEAMEILSHRK